MTTGKWEFTRGQVVVGGIYVGRRGGKRKITTIHIEGWAGRKPTKEDVEFVILEGRRVGQVRTMTMKCFINWCKKRV